jgi:hypothetical protein
VSPVHITSAISTVGPCSHAVCESMRHSQPCAQLRMPATTNKNKWCTIELLCYLKFRYNWASYILFVNVFKTNNEFSISLSSWIQPPPLQHVLAHVKSQALPIFHTPFSHYSLMEGENPGSRIRLSEFQGALFYLCLFLISSLLSLSLKWILK